MDTLEKQQAIAELLERLPKLPDYDEPRAVLHAAAFRLRNRPDNVTDDWWDRTTSWVTDLCTQADKLLKGRIR